MIFVRQKGQADPKDWCNLSSLSNGGDNQWIDGFR